MSRVFEKFQRYFSSSSSSVVSNSSPRGHYVSDSDDEGRHGNRDSEDEEDLDLAEGRFTNPFSVKKAYRQVSANDQSGDIFR